MFNGALKKMITEFDNPVNYFLDIGNDFIVFNSIIDNNITIEFDGYSCLSCGSSQEIYRQGYCKKCFFDLPSTADWVMRPEMSKAHLDIEERDLDYEKKVQLQPHVLYLAYTSEIKVGVTRKSQVPTRWIDQGATKAIQIIELPNRYLAGISEVKLKEFYKDKTNWRKMLKNSFNDIDLVNEKLKCLDQLPEEVKKHIKNDNQTLDIVYPLNKLPENPKSLNIVKTQKFSGKLTGIKGQYLIFENDTVFNIRSNEGIVVNITVN
tara:strand:+ start:260 stop:1051 length:792 start_codon:yes stop_codon:yes gene_type:complete